MDREDKTWKDRERNWNKPAESCLSLWTSALQRLLSPTEQLSITRHTDV